MTIKKFIEFAIEGGCLGYRYLLSLADDEINESSGFAFMLLDPKAWQAVGKVEGWTGLRHCEWADKQEANEYEVWQYHWHSMIDALAEGKSIEEFIKTL